LNYYVEEKYGGPTNAEKCRFRYAINPSSGADFRIEYLELSGCGVVDTFIINID